MNKNLHKAKTDKKDEFYTQLTDIEKELGHYEEHFRDKIVFCNCDDPESSNFWRYFSLKFNDIGLKTLVSTHFETNKPSYKLEYDGKTTTKTTLKQNGDFRSPECIEILKQSDIVVTNPPFSLFREYVEQLVEYDKKFLIIGNMNAITYKETFKLIKEDKLWLGINNGPKRYLVPESYQQNNIITDKDGKRYAHMGNTCWFTNLDIKKRHEGLILYRKYNAKDYPKYDNYNAINVDKIKDIPEDYTGVMGVPITFLDKYNPAQFEIFGSDFEVKDALLPQLVNPKWHGKIDRGYINGERLYSRLLIKKRQTNK